MVICIRKNARKEIMVEKATHWTDDTRRYVNEIPETINMPVCFVMQKELLKN